MVRVPSGTRVVGYSIGNYTGSPTVIDAATGNQLAFVAPPDNTYDGWVGRLIFDDFAKVASGDPNPTVEAGLYVQETNGTWTLLATAPTQTITSTSFTTRTFPFAVAVRVSKSRRYAMALRVKTGRVQYRRADGSGFEPDGQAFIASTNAGASLASPWTPTSSGVLGDAGAVRFFGDGEMNDVPTATQTVPSASGTTSSQIPVFTVRMNDDDISDFADYPLTHWLHIVGSKSDGVTRDEALTRYGPEPVPTGQTTGNTHGFRPPIGLPVGRHWVRQAVSDSLGAQSGWTAWLYFNVTAGASIQPRTMTPSKVEAVNGLSFPVRYENTQAVNAQSVTFYLYQDDVLVRTSNPIPVSWAAGTDQSVTWAQLTTAGLAPSGAWGDLTWGRKYSYAVTLQDVNGSIAPLSAKQAFTTNAAPGVPVLQSPKNNVGATNRPKFRATVTDSDDTVATGVVVYARLKNSAGAVLQTRQMVYNATTKEFEYQTTTTDIPDPAPGVRVDYRWDAYAFDGTLYSNGKTTNDAGSYAPEATFGYIVGPAVTITSPADGSTITTNQPNIVVSWVGAAASQVNFTWRDVETGAVGGWGYGGGTYTSPVSIPHVGNQIYELHHYEYIGHVTVNGVEGHSEPVTVLLDYPDFDAPTNFRAEPFRADGSPNANLVSLTWDPSVYPFGTFDRYFVIAIPEGETEASPNAIRIAEIEDPGRTRVIYAPRGGVNYTYRLRQIVRFGNDYLASRPVDQTLRIDIAGVVLSVANNPTRQAVLLWRGDAPEWTPVSSEDFRLGAASAQGFTWARAVDYLTMTASQPVFAGPTHPLTKEQQWDAIYGLRRNILLYRDWTGAFIYCRFPSGYPRRRERGAHALDIAYALRQEKYTFIPVGQEPGYLTNDVPNADEGEVGIQG